MECYIATIKCRDGGNYEYGLKIQKDSGSFSGKLSLIITRDDRADPTVMMDSDELCENSFSAESAEGVMKLASAFILKKHTPEVSWRNEAF
jgi:hypothetical protein